MRSQRIILPVWAIALTVVPASRPSDAWQDQPAHAGPAAARIALLKGPAGGTATYSIHDDAHPRLTQQHSLSDGHFHLFQGPRTVRISFGNPPREQELLPGLLYEFQWSLRGNFPLLQLNSRPLEPAPEIKQALARTDDLQQAIVQLKGEAADLQDRLDEERRLLQEARQEIERRTKIGAARVVAAPVEPIAVAPIDLGPLQLKNRRATAEITVTAPEGSLQTDSMFMTGALKVPYATATVEPQQAPFDPQGKLKFTLQLDNVPSAADARGQVELRATSGDRRTIIVPLNVRFQPLDVHSDPEPGTVRVLTWPAGARVFLTPISLGDSSQQTRSEVGVTPVELAVAVGRYRVELLPPRSGAGEWAGPVGTAEPLSDADGSQLFVASVSTKADEPTVVRAVWLAHQPAAVADWEEATRDSPVLFSVPGWDAFQRYVARTAAEAGGKAPKETELRKLHDVLAKTGFLRFPIAQELSLDVESPRSGQSLLSRSRRITGMVHELAPLPAKPQ